LTANQPEKLQVDQSKHRVIVPENSEIDGDIIVRNADIAVEGKVSGNVIAIDGQIYLASTGYITGEKQEIDQAVEWAWFQMKRAVYQFIP
jgi:predicted acyltransferase (DUF342 family)